jgi:putative endonuclease
MDDGPRAPKPDPLGARGERLAADHLAAKGFRILARGVRDRLGELDLVAQDGSRLVFVEVKTRSSRDRGEPWEAVTRAKQRKVALAALRFLQRRNLGHVPCRFDVVGVTWPEDGAGQPMIEHFADAFPAPPGCGG